jgi:16S rRNA G1207 methylase RsmC
VVEQSLAHKKARVLVCKEPIKKGVKIFFKNIYFNGINFQQYAGVFSSSHIDYASQYLLNTYKFNKKYTKILDFGCGNGVIAQHISTQNPDASIFCVDDSILAIESTKINLPIAKTIWTHGLSEMDEKGFDLIVSNPPFHFEFETDISVSLKFFDDVQTKLTDGGYLVIVSNKHLNYGTHLKRLFGHVVVIDQNDKFEILEAH